MLDPRNIGYRRMPADRDHDLVSGVIAPGDLDRVRVGDDGAPLDQFDLAVFQHRPINLLEAIELLVFGGDQARPIKTRHRHVPAEPGGVGKGVGKLSAVDQ